MLAGAMVRKDEELVYLRRHALVLETEDVDETQVPDRSFVFGGEPDRADRRGRQQPFQRTSHGAGMEPRKTLEFPVSRDEFQ